MAGHRKTKLPRYSSQAERGTAIKFPNAVMIEILLRLPVKSIVRFRCVSNRWCHVLRSHGFANKHFLQKRINCRMLLMRRLLPTPEFSDVLSFHNLDSIELEEVQPNLPISLLPLVSPSKSRLLGPCNGIVCIVNYDIVILCNPSLHEFRRLPACPSSEESCTMLGEGFGISRNNVFKVVLMQKLANDVGDILVHLYTANTNSWRQIAYKGTTCPSLCYPYNEVFLNGASHWNATTSDHTSHRLILCFDMNREVFKQLEYPERTSAVPIDLTIVNNLLTMLQYERGNAIECETHIWVMREYGVKSSWIKQFIIMSKVLRFPLFWKNDECVMEEKGKGQLMCYGHTTNGNKDIQVYGRPFTFRALIYEESLVKEEMFDAFCYVLDPRRAVPSVLLF